MTVEMKGMGLNTPLNKQQTIRESTLQFETLIIARVYVRSITRSTMGSVELPKTTHLPKTTETHLENHIYRGIIPS